MMQLVLVEEVYVEALQHFDKEDLNQLWALVKETLNIRQATSDKEKELWVELKRIYEPDVEDQLSHVGWKTKHFKEMSLEEIREKFVPVWKQIEDFIPVGSKEEGERMKRKRLRLEQEIPKKLWALVKETLNIIQAISDKEKELWVKLKRIYKPDVEDQL
nr:hypothetical protein [Tanacetum cinerariifolium]